MLTAICIINYLFIYNCFREDLDSFPNVYSVNASNSIDNVTTLWAIVNSSSVSFYNVNNIILPQSTAWDLNVKKI